MVLCSILDELQVAAGYGTSWLSQGSIPTPPRCGVRPRSVSSSAILRGLWFALCRPIFDVPLSIEVIADAGARVVLIACSMDVSALDLLTKLVNRVDNLRRSEHPRFVAPCAPTTSLAQR